MTTEPAGPHRARPAAPVVATSISTVLVAAAALGAFVAARARATADDPAWWLLSVLLVVTVALALAAFATWAVVSVRDLRASRRAAALERWTGTWGGVAADGPVPEVPAGQRVAAAESAARVAQLVSAAGAARVRDGYVTSGLAQADLRAASSSRQRARARSEALQRLARLGPPEARDHLMRSVASRDGALARAALLGVARVLAATPDDERGPMDFVHAVRSYLLTHGPARARRLLTTAVLSSGRWGPACAAALLEADLDPVVRHAALDALAVAAWPEGRTLAAAVLTSGGPGGAADPADGPDAAETRAAALRVLARLGGVPDAALADALRAADDPVVAVRVAAVHALACTPGDTSERLLWRALGDAAWDVRRAAAISARRAGGPYAALLERAKREHPDAFARDVAGVVAAWPPPADRGVPT
jgi:hypothetical protein